MLVWKQLPYFLATARAGSLRGGAAALGATHATTRRQIDALEARLGVRLMTRGRGGVRLTEAGAQLMAEATEAERHVLAAKTRLAGLDREASGTVRLATSGLVAQGVLAPILARFVARRPGIELELSISDDFDDIAGQAADLALRIADHPGQGVEATRLLPLTLAGFARAGYVETGGPRGEGLAWIGDDLPAVRAMIAASPYPAARLRLRAADLASHVALARAGAGMVLLPVWTGACYPDLDRLAGTTQETDYALWLVVQADLSRVTRVRLLHDAIVRALAPGRPG